MIAEIEKRASTDIDVIGHTDRSGAKEFNMALSRRRAERVRDLLVAEGIAQQQHYPQPLPLGIPGGAQPTQEGQRPFPGALAHVELGAVAGADE